MKTAVGPRCRDLTRHGTNANSNNNENSISNDPMLIIIILYLIEKTVLLILRGCLASLKALALREVLRGLACAGFFWIACAGSLARMLSHYNSIIF